MDHQNNNITNKHLDELLDLICDIAAFRFEKKVSLKNDGSMEDAVAASLNMLSEEWENTVISKKVLEASKKQYQDLFEKASIGIIMIDINNDKIINTNQNYCDLIEFKVAEVLNNEYHKFTPEYLIDNQKNWLNKIEKDGQVEFESECLTKNGESKFIEVSASMSTDQNGNDVIIAFVRDIHNKMVYAQKLKDENTKVLKYQSKLLSSQLNPHFLFNALNSIQYHILDENPEQTLDFISNFARLMRSVLNQSQNDFITLKEEIDFLTEYLNLERNRQKNKFVFSINISDDVNPESLLLPPMLLQPYVENSIIHGVSHLANGGKITINLNTASTNRIKCEILDNGLGFEQSKRKSIMKQGEINLNSTTINKTRIDILNSIEEYGNYEIEFVDLKDQKNSIQGTKVVLFFPEIIE